MLRLDSSEMLPGSQKGEETAQILSTAIVVVALATRGSLAMITFTKGNETGRDASRRASLPCARVKMVKHSKLHIRFSDAHLNTKAVDKPIKPPTPLPTNQGRLSDIPTVLSHS